MSRLQKALNRLETQLRDLIEGSAEKIFPSTSIRAELAHELVQAMQMKIRTEPDGSLSAPNLYTLMLPPPQAQALQMNPLLLSEVAYSLQEYAAQAGLQIHGKPMIKVVSSGSQESEMRVLANFSTKAIEETAQLEISPSNETPTIPRGAFLIIKGTQTVALMHAVINIGRADTNDLVISDLQISREHAQLRAIRGRYVVFDLNSTGGTFVNGVQISQHELAPGDLISLADIPLIYGQEQSYQVEETQDLSSFDPGDKFGKDR